MKHINGRNKINVWLYDGKPEYVDAGVLPVIPNEGGYITALVLENRTIRIVATRYPAKYVNAWHNNYVKQYGLPDVIRVLVSKPYIRYEAIKRSLTRHLTGHRDEVTGGYNLSVNALTDMTQTILTEAGLEHAS